MAEDPLTTSFLKRCKEKIQVVGLDVRLPMDGIALQALAGLLPTARTFQVPCPHGHA